MSSLVAHAAAVGALVVSGAALVAAALTLAVTRRPAAALGVLLDLLLAAGLLRLTGTPAWQTLGTAALVVLLRRLGSVGSRADQRPGAGTGPAGRRRPAWLHRLPADVGAHLVRPAWRA